MKIYLKLVYKENCWVAYNKEIKIKAKSLNELDEKLKEELRKRFGKGKKIRVLMEYDYKTFPFWIIQYHPIYFYRILEFNF